MALFTRTGAVTLSGCPWGLTAWVEAGCCGGCGWPRPVDGGWNVGGGAPCGLIGGSIGRTAVAAARGVGMGGMLTMHVRQPRTNASHNAGSYWSALRGMART